MNLDSEDGLAPGDALASRPAGAAPDPVHPAALFTRRPEAVPVVVKRRRLPQPPGAGASAAEPPSADTPADDAGRRPRVFVLAKERPAPAAADPAGASAPAVAETAPGPNRRRRRPALHRPSPVVLIVPPAPAEAAEPDPLGLPVLPAVDEYAALKASLQGLRALVDDARRANAFAIRTGRPRGR